MKTKEEKKEELDFLKGEFLYDKEEEERLKRQKEFNETMDKLMEKGSVLFKFSEFKEFIRKYTGFIFSSLEAAIIKEEYTAPKELDFGKNYRYLLQGVLIEHTSSIVEADNKIKDIKDWAKKFLVEFGGCYPSQTYRFVKKEIDELSNILEREIN